jgi:type II secretory pathway pseudopilin PulG
MKYLAQHSSRSHTSGLHQHGFTYLTIIFVVALLSGGLALLGDVWHTASQREKEAELLFIGHEYRKAIQRYYLAGQRIYPRNLDDLLKDPRRPTTERYLRKRYADPITGTTEWGVVKAPDGGIMGVHSLSDTQPLKIANFRIRDKGFTDTEKYSDWKFIYTPPQQAGAGKPASKPPVVKPPISKP